MIAVAVPFPWLALMMRRHIIQGLICLLLQMTLIGWLPAAIWAVIVINNDNQERRHRELIDALQPQAESSLLKQARLAALKSQQKLPAVVAISMTLTLAGCGGPSTEDVGKAFGRRDISNVSCTAANGQPGYVCTFMSGGNNFTFGFIKSDGGGWHWVN